LDVSGRDLLSHVGITLTTLSVSKRLGTTLKNVKGLKDWDTHELVGDDGFKIKVQAMPARHGPPFSSPIVGDVIGFLLEWQGQQSGALYITGDTVLYDGLLEIGKRCPKIGTAIMHLGSVKFPLTFGIKYTMTGEEAAILAQKLSIREIYPIHFEGWSHFQESKDQSHTAFQRAGLESKVHWLQLGHKNLVNI